MDHFVGLLPLHALCISKLHVTVHVVLEGHSTKETKNSGTLSQETESKVTGASDKDCVEVTMVLKASHVCVLAHQDETCPNSWGL